jgi:hypothetical protein
MKSWAVASFSVVTKRLVVCTRGRKKDDVLRAVIRELYRNATQTHSIPEWRLSAKQKKELNERLSAQMVKAEAALTAAASGEL